MAKEYTNYKDLGELYFKILSICARDFYTTQAKIAKELNISHNRSAFSYLEKLGFITILKNSGDSIELTQSGFSTYLAISRQEHSNKQAIKATKFAIWAIVISIISYITSIIFNIISLN
jgi:hypothetical protein